MAITINSSLKRQAVIADHLTALSRIMSPLKAFSRAHNDVPLQGTNKIAVPYIPLENSTSVDFVAANGYVAGDATVSAKEITVNKRKYQSLGNDSETHSRQPYTMTDELIQAKLEKLCFDVMSDIMSAITISNFAALTAVTGVAATDVLTTTNHGLTTGQRVDVVAITGGAGITAGAITFAIVVSSSEFKLATTAANALAGTAIDFTTNITAATLSQSTGFTGAASGFGISSIGALRKVAVDCNYPESRRAIVLNSSFDQFAMVDPAVLNALNYGSNEAVREGRVGRVLGFDYYGGKYVPTNGENLGGFICLPSALLIGCAPIAPSPAVRTQLNAYEQFTIPDLDIVLSYREFADAQKDSDQSIIECSYGYAVGEQAALKRIVTA